MSSLTPEVFEVVAEESGAVLLDTRPATDFYKGYVPQSINIGLKGDFAPWVGSLIADVNQPILLITSPGEEEESVTRLSRVGFDNVLGHLEGGVDEWIKSGKEIDTVDRITVDAFKGALESGGHQILDVRKESEYEGGHVANAENKPLANINDWIRDINPAKHYLIHCAGGYRSMVAASILQARGYRNFSEIEGGYAAISQSIIAQGAMLVDVRNPDEYKSGHVKGSVNIPLDQISQRLDRFKNKNTIVVFCRSGARSKMAQSILKSNGVTNVINGGGWQEVNQFVK